MSRKQMPTNTTRLVRDNPYFALLEYSAPGSIERSERQGQGEIVNSTALPTDARGDDDALRALGFTLGEPDARDPLFRPATLPEGWSREGGDHAMWSYIVDGRGIQRVAVFYKAAFYDRAAHMGLINVGRAVARDALYGDDEPTAESLRLVMLTPAEMADFRAGLDAMAKDITDSPNIYGKYADKLARCRALLQEATR